ncbi:20541_t:CDS:2, partial [Cetraspora pellucida]
MNQENTFSFGEHDLILTNNKADNEADNEANNDKICNKTNDKTEEFGEELDEESGEESGDEAEALTNKLNIFINSNERSLIDD